MPVPSPWWRSVSCLSPVCNVEIEAWGREWEGQDLNLGFWFWAWCFLPFINLVVILIDNVFSVTLAGTASLQNLQWLKGKMPLGSIVSYNLLLISWCFCSMSSLVLPFLGSPRFSELVLWMLRNFLMITLGAGQEAVLGLYWGENLYWGTSLCVSLVWDLKHSKKSRIRSSEQIGKWAEKVAGAGKKATVCLES